MQAWLSSRLLAAFQFLEGDAVQNCPCVAYLEYWFHTAVKLSPRAELIVLDLLHYSCFDKILLAIRLMVSPTFSSPVVAFV